MSVRAASNRRYSFYRFIDEYSGQDSVSTVGAYAVGLGCCYCDLYLAGYRAVDHFKLNDQIETPSARPSRPATWPAIEQACPDNLDLCSPDRPPHNLPLRGIHHPAQFHLAPECLLQLGSLFLRTALRQEPGAVVGGLGRWCRRSRPT